MGEVKRSAYLLSPEETKMVVEFLVGAAAGAAVGYWVTKEVGSTSLATLKASLKAELVKVEAAVVAAEAKVKADVLAAVAKVRAKL
jgi:hypothetical protein